MDQEVEQGLFGMDRAPVRYGMSLRKRRVWTAPDGEDDPEGGDDGTPPGEDHDDPDDGQNAGDEISFTPKQQAHLQKILDANTKRLRKKWETDLKAKEDKDKAEADRKRLEDEGQFKELKTVTDERDAYKARVEAVLKQTREGLPAHIIALLDKLDPNAQLDWIAENAEALGTPDRRKGIPSTPRGDPHSEADKQKRREEAKQVANRRTKSRF